ncbi:MAG TPA: hypothetical protein PLG90_05695 [Ignavibacteria bacterium]|nr:hypothetical protein [Ignavibacteria bacterium]
MKYWIVIYFTFIFNSCFIFNQSINENRYYIVTYIDTSFFIDYNLIELKNFNNFENSENFYILTKKNLMKNCNNELKKYDKIQLKLFLNENVIVAKSKRSEIKNFKIQNELIWEFDTVKVKNFYQDKIKGLCKY